MPFMERFSLKGKNILITGGSRGIGRVVAGCLADAGANIGILGTSTETAQKAAAEIAKEHGVRARGYGGDISNPEDVEASVSEFVKDFGQIDVLFNNAGICQHKPVMELTYDEWLKVIDVNVNGTFLMAHAAAKYMIRDGVKGSIINTASISGSIVNLPQPQAAYNTSKAGVVHLTKVLAVELCGYGIRVNSISPGYTMTEMISSVDPSWIAYWKNAVPMHRLASPEELAGAVVYLASAASSYTTGADLIIDGGFTCL
ncbi:MAG: SDR family oxidoreductase [Oscillospiraceae bacterium]|nr:SDR family oxidoreductase [Oscillospiraceae bacterium]